VGSGKGNDQAVEATTLGHVLGPGRVRSSIPEEEWLDLLKSIANGDQLALRSLYERTNRMVFTLMVRITRNRETAEELTLDVFHDVWRRAPTYDPANGSVVGWVLNQARSRAIDRLRYEQRKKRVNGGLQDNEVAVTVGDPQSAFDIKEQSLLLRGALANLNREEVQAIEMAFFSELTHQEVAARLNEPLGTVKTRIRSGLMKLRKALVRAVGKY
jgi:RNA polymerase sigma-70 factor (ECF subfamily)